MVGVQPVGPLSGASSASLRALSTLPTTRASVSSHNEWFALSAKHELLYEVRSKAHAPLCDCAWLQDDTSPTGVRTYSADFLEGFGGKDERTR